MTTTTGVAYAIDELPTMACQCRDSMRHQDRCAQQPRRQSDWLSSAIAARLRSSPPPWDVASLRSTRLSQQSPLPLGWFPSGKRVTASSNHFLSLTTPHHRLRQKPLVLLLLALLPSQAISDRAITKTGVRGVASHIIEKGRRRSRRSACLFCSVTVEVVLTFRFALSTDRGSSVGVCVEHAAS